MAPESIHLVCPKLPLPLPTYFLRLCHSKGKWSKKAQKLTNIVFEHPRNRLLEIDILLPLVTSIAISVTVTSDIKPKCQSAIYLTEGKVRKTENLVYIVEQKIDF